MYFLLNNHFDIFMVTVIPTEEQECIAFVAWLKLNRLPFSHLAQSTFTKSFSVINRNKRMGVVKGVPDFIIVLPGKALAFVEMKRTKKGAVSREQAQWIVDLNSVPNVEARVCKGAMEAIVFINEILQESAASERKTTTNRSGPWQNFPR